MCANDTDAKKTPATNPVAPEKSHPEKTVAKEAISQSGEALEFMAENAAAAKKAPAKKKISPAQTTPPQSKGSHRANRVCFKHAVATALRKMGINVESLYQLELISVYDAVTEAIVPLVGRRKHGGSTAGVDGKVIFPFDGVNIGASFTTSLLYRREPVKHMFMKKEQVAGECQEGCKHSFVLPRSLFNSFRDFCFVNRLRSARTFS